MIEDFLNPFEVGVLQFIEERCHPSNELESDLMHVQPFVIEARIHCHDYGWKE